MVSKAVQKGGAGLTAGAAHCSTVATEPTVMQIRPGFGVRRQERILLLHICLCTKLYEVEGAGKLERKKDMG